MRDLGAIRKGELNMTKKIAGSGSFEVNSREIRFDIFIIQHRAYLLGSDDLQFRFVKNFKRSSSNFCHKRIIQQEHQLTKRDLYKEKGSQHKAVDILLEDCAS